MKKRTSLILALGLTVGAVMPLTAAAQPPYNILPKVIYSHGNDTL